MQIISVELDKALASSIVNYQTIEKSLDQLINLTSNKEKPDLHLMRKLRLIPCCTEICKQINLCQKNQILDLRKAIEKAIHIFRTFVKIRENREYLLTTSKIIPLVDLFQWFLKFKSQSNSNSNHLFLFGVSFMPELLEVITMCIKHRCSLNTQNIKEQLLEYLLCSSIWQKLSQKFVAI